MDLLTKALPSSTLNSHLLNMGVVNYHCPSCGRVLQHVNAASIPLQEFPTTSSMTSRWVHTAKACKEKSKQGVYK